MTTPTQLAQWCTKFESRFAEWELVLYEGHYADQRVRDAWGDYVKAREDTHEQTLEIKNGKAIDTAYTWTSMDDPECPCPTGVKLQLLGAGGIPIYGSWNGRDPFFTHYALLPSHQKEQPNE
jgi:hypothetical protein